MDKWTGSTAARFPTREKILPVYSVIVFIVYGWALIKFFYQLPSWLYFLALDEITAIAGAVFLHAFLESLFVTFVLIAVAAILPRAWAGDNFVVFGSFSALTFYLSTGLYLYYTTEKNFLAWFPYWGIATIFLAGSIAFLVSRFDRPRRMVASLADRFVVFLYLQIPFTLLACIFFVVRNLG